jgi:hypothetical protein
MVFPLRSSEEEAKRRMAVSGFASIRESEAAAIENNYYDYYFLFCTRGIVHHEFIPQRRTGNQEFYISILRCMHEAL